MFFVALKSVSLQHWTRRRISFRPKSVCRGHSGLWGVGHHRMKNTYGSHCCEENLLIVIGVFKSGSCLMKISIASRCQWSLPSRRRFALAFPPRYFWETWRINPVSDTSVSAAALAVITPSVSRRRANSELCKCLPSASTVDASHHGPRFYTFIHEDCVLFNCRRLQCVCLIPVPPFTAVNASNHFVLYI